MNLNSTSLANSVNGRELPVPHAIAEKLDSTEKDQQIRGLFKYSLSNHRIRKVKKSREPGV